MSRNRSTPEKAAIWSKRARTSLRDMPRIAPLRNTFSRPVSSSWKPVPTSSRALSRPRTRATPAVGAVIRARILKQRGLARTVAADDADQFTVAHAERDVLQRPEVHALGGTAAAHPVRDDLGEQHRARAPADRVALAQPGDLDGVAH